jgi:hypothetical protein
MRKHQCFSMHPKSWFSSAHSSYNFLVEDMEETGEKIRGR